MTHDRYFMDQVSNQILAFIEGSTELITFSSFLQWQDYQSTLKKPDAHSNQKSKAAPDVPVQSKKKLSFKDQRDLETIEEKIQKAEEKLTEIQTQLTLPENLSQFAKLTELTASLKQQQTEVENLYKRWQSLTS